MIGNLLDPGGLTCFIFLPDRVFVLIGAGASAESHIPTFGGAGG